ncbi:aldo/keto reductase [Streptosporangium sp. 'caverna']|uniref:aldo/keto reductase n=1 Tax=Streptosporangium sp. 'caverna' TaxID=2202249 RepID=UPI000D7E8052|nr:aldo/keto reductase [Streptosporangium sp. 'caverna']AWS47315.1 oxidoreductase [Streptosporangium sp. 'caverna']
MRMIKLPFGEEVVALGQGTWHMAEDPSRREEEITALRLGLELGMTLIDTAEMYGGGSVERLVGEAVAGLRDEVFLVGKVLPHHATTEGTITACRDSLRRLGTDWFDLYLLHWRGPTPLEETLAAFEKLTARGDIRSWGVSNFDLPDMEELAALTGGSAVQTDQVLYNVTRRGIEYDLLPWCRERRIPTMAYSPIEQGRLIGHPALNAVAARHRATTTQVALAWVLRDDDVIAIPKTGKPEHVRQNQATLDIHLTEEDLNELDMVFSPPPGPRPLEIL